MSKMKKVAIQGIKGSYHDEAAHQLLGNNIELLECLSFPDLAKAVVDEEVEVAVMAIENSIAGSILPNYNLMLNNDLHIVDELYMPINHCFMIHKDAELEEITEVHSHPMALMQCEEYFEQYAKIRLVEVADTALAAQRIVEKDWMTVGAIAPERSAQVYGLQIIDKGIQAVKNNYTRFFVLEKNPKPITDFNKVSIQFKVPHQSGSLARVLNQIAFRRINMSKIQSVPIIDEPMNYAFFADLVLDDASEFQEFIHEVQPLVKDLKILGKYKNKSIVN